MRELIPHIGLFQAIPLKIPNASVDNDTIRGGAFFHEGWKLL